MDCTNPSHAIFFARQNGELHECASISSGLVHVYSARSPEKASDNEDAAAIIPIDENRAILAVADGVGGQPGGAVAAELTLQTLAECARKAGDRNRILRDVIMEGIEQANIRVSELGIGAATTLAAVEIEGSTVRPYHVGDSMILIVGQRGKILHQTVPHSPVGYAVEAGLLDEKEAIHHTDRHVVSNIVGSPNMRSEVGSVVHLKQHDTVLLASDGIFDNLHVAEIVELIRKGPLSHVDTELAIATRSRMNGEEAHHPCKPDDTTYLLFRLGSADEPARSRGDNISSTIATPTMTST